jgi:hypothetical protein
MVAHKKRGAIMIEFKSLLFPDSDYQLVASLCYLLIFLTAYKRYNTLIINYGAYDAPETARPWTTWLRYHGSAVIYACLYAIFFTTLYQLFHKHPVLIDAAREMLGDENPFGKSLAKLGTDMKLISPILAFILLTWGAEKYRKTAAADRKLRYYFQRMGSIPGEVSLTIRNLKKYELEVNTDECMGNLSEEMKNEITLPLLQNDPKSLEHHYLRACHLFSQIEHWNSPGSDFFQFQSAYHQAFENIKTRYEKVYRNASRYYQLKLKSATDADSVAGNCEGIARSKFDSIYPKILTELRKDLKNDLKSILENLYIFMACAVHSEGITAKQRKKLLQSFGFKITGGKQSNASGVDPNDLTILAIFLIFVIPLSAVVARVAGDDRLITIASMTYVVWSAMALFIGLASVAIPIVIKQVKDSSDHRFWICVRPKKGPAWCSYLVSGVMAGAAGILVMFLLSFLVPGNAERPLTVRVARIIPWGLLPLSIAFILGYHLDRKTADGKRTIVIEALTTMLAAMLAAVLALVINAGIIHWSELLPRMYFSLTSAALLGSIIGAVIPNRIRGQINRGTKVVLEEVNLNASIQSCMDKFADRAKKDNVKITAVVADNLPVLIADPGKIKLVINGLISNALEFTPGEGRITISASVDSQGGIRLSVKDDGIGMSSHKMRTVVDAPPEKIHAAWEQVGDSEDADLIQIHSIVEKHGGKFKLNSRQWEGTEATVEFPHEPAYAETSTPRPERPLQGPLESMAA